LHCLACFFETGGHFTKIVPKSVEQPPAQKDLPNAAEPALQQVDPRTVEVDQVHAVFFRRIDCEAQSKRCVHVVVGIDLFRGGDCGSCLLEDVHVREAGDGFEAEVLGRPVKEFPQDRIGGRALGILGQVTEGFARKVPDAGLGVEDLGQVNREPRGHGSAVVLD